MSDLVRLGGAPRSPPPAEAAPASPAPLRRVFVQTFGCQMNEVDSDRMVELLARHRYVRAATPEEADLILVNTCAVREKGAQKLLSSLGRLRAVKARRGAILAVAGCVAQQEREELLRRVPYLDLVIGPDNVARLPELVDRALDHERVVATAWLDPGVYRFPRADPEAARGRVTAFVTVMKGCDNVCAFCIVPRTRGREISRPVAEVLAECADLAAAGVREVTLVGQNVNSYRGGCGFPELLRRVAALPGIARIRFTTSHPHDLSSDLVAALRDEPKVMPHVHLPLQSGSDAMLARMRRDYDVEAYLSRHEALARARPGVAITTDFIVGFPGETEEDFQGSLRVLERAGFENSFAFLFSPRPGTAAARRLGSAPEWAEVPRPVASERLERLLALQRRITGARYAAEVGAEVEILVEGEGDEPGRRVGRTPENRLVHLDATAAEAPAGRLARVRVTRAGRVSLTGRLAGAPAAGEAG